MKTPAQRQRCGVSSSYLGSPRPSLTSLVAQMVKHPPTMWETWFQSLAWEGLLEKELETHSSIPAWEIPRTWRPQSMGLQELDRT